MTYLVSSYCSLYGHDETFLIENIDDIIRFIIDYIIYPESIYKNEDFKLSDIPTRDEIEDRLNNSYTEYFSDEKFIDYTKHKIVFEATRYNAEYYVTVINLEDVKTFTFEEDYLKKIKEYLNFEKL